VALFKNFGQTLRNQHNPEGLDYHMHRCENLRSRVDWKCWRTKCWRKCL